MLNQREEGKSTAVVGGSMSESPVDEMKILPQVPVKPVIPAIPTDDKEFRELKEDLQAMGCEGLLARPWTSNRRTC